MALNASQFCCSFTQQNVKQPFRCVNGNLTQTGERKIKTKKKKSSNSNRILIVLGNGKKTSLSGSRSSWTDDICLIENAVHSILKLCFTFKAVLML